MRFSGKVYEEGGFWLAEIPILDIMTQGHSTNDAYEMAKDAIESLVNIKNFQVEIYKGENGYFEIASPDAKHLISFPGSVNPFLRW